MLKSDKFYTNSSSLLASVILIIIGTIMIIGKDKLYFDFMNLFILAILILGVLQFLRYLFPIANKNNNKKNITFTKSFLYLIFCLVLLLFPKIPMSILPIVFASYLILNAIIKLFTYVILFQDKTNGRIRELLLFFVYLSIGIPLLFSPLKKVEVMLTLIGVYFIILGINYFIDYITTKLSSKFKNNIRRRIKITLPVFLEAIIPYQVLNEINDFINGEEQKNKMIYEEKNSDIVPDMEIFVHCSNNGFNRLGHVDLCFDGWVYSYGNYDDSSASFFTMIGDGVFFKTNKDDYIPFCIKHSSKTIFGFGLKLNNSQKKRIKNYIDSLLSNTTEWYPPIVQDMLDNKKINKKKYTDYASCLYNASNAKFYKPTKGKFKEYFVLGLNCCMLADSVIGKSGTDVIKINGIITPGTYYEYLNREFRKKNSIVVTKNIYNSESTKLKSKKKKKNKKEKKEKGFSGISR